MRETKSRSAILSVLESESILSAQQIHKKLPEFDLATIYRNLKRFVQEGIVRELNMSKEESLYEKVQDDHQHAQCVECGKINHIVIPKDKIMELLDLKDFDVEDIDLYIKGRCKKKKA
jgi:Fur family transcriptional regulator, peroxide stress response regulator